MEITYSLFPGLHGTSCLYSQLAIALGNVNIEYIQYPTDIPQSYASLEQWAIENLDWNIPRVIIAESFSGPLALKLTERFSSSVQALVLAASFCVSPVSPHIALLPIRTIFMLKPPIFLLKYFLIGTQAPLQSVIELKDTITKIPSKILYQRISAVLKLKKSDCPLLSDVPMLILQAKEDNVIPWQVQNILQKQYKHANIHWLDSPHLILQSNLDLCSAIIQKFVENNLSHKNA